MAITQNDPIAASDVVAALNEKANSSHKHAKSDITDFPTIPTKTSQLTNDSGFLAGLPSHNHDERYYTENEVRNTLWNLIKGYRLIPMRSSTGIVLPSCNVSERKYFYFTLIRDDIAGSEDVYIDGYTT